MQALHAPRATRARGATVSQRSHHVAAYHGTHTVPARGRAPGKAVVMPMRRAAAGERLAVVWRRSGVGSLRVVASAEARTARVILSTEEMRAWSRENRAAGQTVALVPTMGYLHDGHLSLVRAAAEQADVVVVSVYVNESQFAEGEDLDIYPRDMEGDLEKLSGLADVVFCPTALYPQGVAAHQSYVQVEELQKPLCGVSRPIFFRGVATVVTKLLNITEPDVAVFGRKDYQQWRILTQMVHDLDFPVKVVGLPLVREADGLAMSSRNVRLTPDERRRALSIHDGLCAVAAAVEKGELATAPHVASVKAGITAAGGVLDYVEAVDAMSLEAVDSVSKPTVFVVAAKFGTVRLIDNMVVGEAL